MYLNYANEPSYGVWCTIPQYLGFDPYLSDHKILLIYFQITINGYAYVIFLY